VHTFSPLPREAVVSLDVSPRDKQLVAVGYRSGALCVVDVVEKHVRYRLNGHELEVQSCVWASSGVPTPVDYLATASRDRSIKVWAFPHGGSDGQEPSLAARLEVRKPQQASSHGQSTRLWLPLAWTYDSGSDGGVKYGLWTGSFEGNLQLFQWKGAPNGTIKSSVVVKNGHNRLLFGIASLCASSAVPSNVDGTRYQLPPLMATISLDRELRVWREDLTSTTKTASLLTCLERIPAQGGFTYSLDFNASKKLLACGVGDQTIRVWNLLAKPSTGGYQTELVWKGLQSKVTGVCWHPVQDHVLAFGTEDGRVGVWDSRGKTTQRLKVKHAGEIHQLQWTVHTKATSASEGVGGGSSFEQAVKALEQAQAQGESLEDAMAQQQTHGAQRSASDVTFFLWSCDRSGLLCRTDVDKDASTEIRKDCGAFAWDTSSEYLAIGLNSGKVDILTCTESSMMSKHDSGVSPHASIFEHKEAVSAASWRDPDVSSACVLASGTKSGEILVYEGLSAGSASPRRFSQLPGYGERVIAVFQAHSGVVNCLRWSRNTESCLLASCGDDGAVKVWDVSGRALVSAFHLHANRVFSVAWITSTVLSSCGQDQSIRLWDYEDHPSAGLENGKAVRMPNLPTTRVSSHQATTSPESQETVEPAATKSNSKSRGKKKIAKAESVFSMEDVQWMLPPKTAHANSLDSAGSARETTRNGITAKRTMLEQVRGAFFWATKDWSRTTHRADVSVGG
jgi:gem associated protein 5